MSNRDSQSFSLAKSSKLTFKNDTGPMKSEKKKKKKKDKKDKKKSKKSDKDQEDIVPETIEGEGRIVSSGKSIHGMETTFKDQCEVGDILIVMHPVSLVPEEQTIVGILSQRSMSVNEPFSQDLVSTMKFEIRKEGAALRKKAERDAEKDGEDLNDLGQDEVSKRLQKQLKKKLKHAPRVVHVREKSGMWGYKTRTITLKEGESMEDALDARSKKVHDHWC